MQHTIDRPRGSSAGGRPESRTGGRRRRSRPVMLATFQSAPFQPDAARLAVDAAIESACPLLVVNVLEYVPAGRPARYEPPPDPPALAAALAAPAELAHAFGVRVERLRVRSPHPVAALLDLVAERRPALIAFGPDGAALRRLRQPSWRRYRRFVEALEREAPGLLWTAQGRAPGAVPSA
jgi:nucleotide-binding universal stress UspA family protein